MTRPLVYYSVAIFMGCLSCLIFINNIALGAVIAASFLCVLYFTLHKKFLYITFCFFFVAIVNYYAYFNVNLPREKMIKVRILEKTNYSCIAVHNNRKIILKGNIFELSEGRNLIVYGDFNKQADYEKGIIGVYAVKHYRNCERDYILYMEEVRKGLNEKFSKFLGEENAAVVMAICFGDSRYINIDQREDFKKLGISHVISVSGLHMSIVYKALEGITGYRIAIFFSFIYMVFTGGKAATVRAFIMIFILKLSSKVYKKYDSLSALSLSAMVLLIMRPFYILDMGFMLSFLSVLGIILYNKKIRKFLYKLPSVLNESFSLSISAQIFSLPYALFALKTFSPGFIISNLILLPIYTIVVILGNVAMLCSGVPLLFQVVNYGLLTILTIIQYVQGALSVILPEIIYFSYIDSLIIFGLYLCYIGVKKGYSQFKYIPVFLMFISAFQYYKIFPEISYLNLSKNDTVLLQYKDSSMIISIGNINVEDIKVPLKDAKVIINYRGDSNINYVNKYVIRLISNKNTGLELQVRPLVKVGTKADEQVFNNKTKGITGNGNIMKLQKDKKYTPKGTIINKYIIIKNKVFKF